MPRLVLSDSGVAERDCIFTTPAAATSPEAEAIWTVLEQDPAAGTVENAQVPTSGPATGRTGGGRHLTAPG
jgi:hypothetical protein